MDKERTELQSARETLSATLKEEQGRTQQLKLECEELKHTCEEYKVEVNSLLQDLQEHTTNITSLEGERDQLKQQVYIQV